MPNPETQFVWWSARARQSIDDIGRHRRRSACSPLVEPLNVRHPQKLGSDAKSIKATLAGLCPPSFTFLVWRAGDTGMIAHRAGGMGNRPVVQERALGHNMSRR